MPMKRLAIVSSSTSLSSHFPFLPELMPRSGPGASACRDDECDADSISGAWRRKIEATHR